MQNMQELVVIKQLPIIEESLRKASDKFKEKTEFALSLVCSEDSVKTVKDIRADITKDFKEIEALRKKVKNKILEPYNKFEEAYKSYITSVYLPADKQLKAKIDDVENELKTIKRKEVEDYFNEYLMTTGIDFVDFNTARINVTLSASMKSLKEQAKAFIDKISDDLSLIETQEHKDEIFVEYKQTLNVTQAITVVASRHKAIEEQKRKAEENAKKEVEKPQVEKIEAFSAPVKIEPVKKEKIYETIFSVKGTMGAISALQDFLDKGGYDYKNL